ncbi:MAG: metallophosphoesterase [Sandaracinaceae bacterium]|nr:metallophosphoesterase [Sandaracinaceae bacterium]
MMLAWATDIHLDFLEAPERRAFAEHVASTGCEALLLTGDISDQRALGLHLVEIADTVGVPVYFVLGNHDYYHGAVESGRRSVRELCAKSPRLTWLHASEVVPLRSGVGLVGVDGWGDARLGAPDTTPILLNDFRYIEELAWLDTKERNAVLRGLGDESASRLVAQLEAALPAYERLIVATHIPPFAEACWHEGALSDDQWLPFFSCAAVGAVLLEAADAHPTTTLEVYCGHTHSPGVAALRPNLVVHTGGARYGHPCLADTISLPPRVTR